jgi:hypothetical protein
MSLDEQHNSSHKESSFEVSYEESKNLLHKKVPANGVLHGRMLNTAKGAAPPAT